MSKLLKYLEKAEGKLIHINDGEKDITCPYGIYNKPHSKMYQYIVELGESIGIDHPTSTWTQDDIDEVNELVKLSAYGVEQLATEFYKNFLKPANLELYPQACQDVMVSLYINSPKYSLMAVQRSIIKMVKSNRIGLLLDEVSIEDGSWGQKTKDSLKLILTKNIEFSWYFEEAIINNMEDIYEDLDDKAHLNGWKNRVRYFQDKE